MLRKEKERTDTLFLEEVLSQADAVYVGFATEGAPYVLPLNYVYHAGRIFIHCALEGHKLDLVRRNPLVGFSVVAEAEILREKSTTRYRSVCGTGRAFLVEDAAAKQEALRLLAQRYAARCTIPAPEKQLARVAILCIEILEMCGKQSPGKA